MDSKPIPVYLGYGKKEIVGTATFNRDNNILMVELSDPTTVRLLDADLKAVHIDAIYTVPFRCDLPDEQYPWFDEFNPEGDNND